MAALPPEQREEIVARYGLKGWSSKAFNGRYTSARRA